MRTFFLGTVFVYFSIAAMAQTVSPLFSRGYTVIPEPQRVTLGARDFKFDSHWDLKLAGVAPSDVAVQTLREDLSHRFDLALPSGGMNSGVLSLRIQQGSVAIGNALDTNKTDLEDQAYQIDLHPNSITITANAATGLFYGVETFIQLLRPDLGKLWLPEGAIVDWPDLHLRHIYWDDNHHLERMDAFKHAIRQAAFYKINGFVVKLDGHFQYKSAPAVVEPYALSPAQLQELTDYGLHYHVQLIPYLDGPAHISFILKHPEYQKLREFPDSNYEICATNPQSYKLLEGMYQDLLDANKGVKYFYLSTDEPYFLGMAHNSQCDEAAMAKKLGSVGQVFAHFVTQSGGYLHDHGRTVMFWGEFPLKPSDIPALPPYMVNGEVYGPSFDRAFHQHGIRQMIFTSAEGAEPFFPDYFILPERERLHPGLPTDEFADAARVSRLTDITKEISTTSARANTSIIGEINAGWGDEGLHPETFWLGYVAGAAAGWHPGSPNIEEMASTFYSVFYGPRAVNMDRIYRLMSHQAQSWNDSWDPIESAARKPLWGSYYAIFNPPHPAHDQAIPLPPVPGADLSYSSTWSKENSRRVDLSSKAMEENDVLLAMLNANMHRAQFNRYNLEVYLSIARLCRQSFEMIVQLQQMDQDMAGAAKLKSTDPEKALAQLDQALDTATSIWLERNRALRNAETTWNKTWFPRVSEANGRKFLDEVSDVKDHLPGRTVDMTYLVYREKLLPFGKWADSIAAARNQFAETHHLPTRNYRLAWDDFQTTASVCPRDSESSNADHSAACSTGH